jgi:hypothetical protein
MDGEAASEAGSIEGRLDLAVVRGAWCVALAAWRAGERRNH